MDIVDVDKDKLSIRKFSTGATRDSEEGKLDMEGFFSPLVLERYAQYMHKHRKQSDGTLRDSDNWQKGIGLSVYMKSGWRHLFSLWKLHRGGKVIDERDGHSVTREEAACGILFNFMGYLHELLTKPGTGDVQNVEFTSDRPFAPILWFGRDNKPHRITLLVSCCPKCGRETGYLRANGSAVREGLRLACGHKLVYDEHFTAKVIDDDGPGTTECTEGGNGPLEFIVDIDGRPNRVAMLVRHCPECGENIERFGYAPSFIKVEDPDGFTTLRETETKAGMALPCRHELTYGKHFTAEAIDDDPGSTRCDADNCRPAAVQGKEEEREADPVRKCLAPGNTAPTRTEISDILEAAG